MIDLRWCNIYAKLRLNGEKPMQKEEKKNSLSLNRTWDCFREEQKNLKNLLRSMTFPTG